MLYPSMNDVYAVEDPQGVVVGWYINFRRAEATAMQLGHGYKVVCHG